MEKKTIFYFLYDEIAKQPSFGIDTKDDAADKWKEALKDPEIKAIISGAEKYANHCAEIVRQEKQLQIDKQIERTAESVSYTVAFRESELDEELNTLKQDIRMLCGLIKDFEWPKHLVETISNVVMNAEAHTIS